MDNNWKGIKQAITSTRNEVLSSKHEYEEWISLDTLDSIQGRKSKKTAINNNRKAEKAKSEAEYTEARQKSHEEH